MRFSLGKDSYVAVVEVLSEDGVIGEFHAESGKVSDEKEIFIRVGQTVKTLTIRFDTMMHDLVINKLHICGAEFDGNMLFPLPAKRQNREGHFALSAFSDIITTIIEH